MAKSDKLLPLPRPLYAGAQSVESVDVGKGNAGLWYDKFCNRWQVDRFQAPDERRRDPAIPDDPTWADILRLQAQASRGQDQPTCSVNKLAWIRTVTRQPVGNASVLAEFATRQRDLAKSLGGDSLTLKTEARFATGLGRDHPIENGFAWHPILGTPYLAGSGVKGFLRAFVGDWEENGVSLANQIFGTDSPFRVGKVVCFDAVPILPVQLEADVMTPHYGPYYESTGPQVVPPGDWHSPTPIPFLVVACGQPFQFTIAPRRAEDRAYVATMFEWLRQGLHWLGAGAKTAVGYGRFERDEEGERKMLQEADQHRKQVAARRTREDELRGLSHELAALVQRADAEQWTSNQTRFLDGAERYLAEHSKPTAECIDWIRTNGLELFWKGIWHNPDAVSGKQKKPKFSVRASKLVHRLKDES